MVCPCAMASRLQTLLSLLLISYYLPHSTTALSRPIDIPALLSDPSRTNIEVSTGYELFQALASQGDSISNVTVTLVSDILLDDPVWEIDLTLSEDVVDAIFKVGSNSTLLFRSSYPLSISESDLETNPQAILEAGAKILDFAQRLAALVVEPGGTIAFQGIAIRGIGSAQAFQQQRESSFYYPHNFAIWPTVLCGVDLSLAPEDPRAACNIIHLNTYATYRPAFKEGCGPEIMEQSVFRSATAIQNYTAIGLSDPTTIYVLGVHQLLFPVIQLESRADVYSEKFIGTEPVSFVRVVTNNTVRACCSGACYENELNESSGRTSINSSGGGSGVPYWVWIIVGATSAVGVLAAALLIFSTTCCRHRLKAKGDGKDQFGDDDDYPDPEAGTITAQMAAAAVKDDEVMRLMTHAWLNRIAAAHELEFKGILGRGASGTVWKANWKGVVVACKILNTTAPQFSRQSFWPPPPVTTDVASEGQGGGVDGGVSKLSPKANTDEVDSVVQGITAAAAGAATTSLTSKAASSALKTTSTTSSTTALDKHTIAAMMTVPKEVCISTLLSHPRIITFYKVTPSTIPTSPSFSMNGSDIVSIILMEYCDLGNLYQCIQRKKKLWYGDGKPVMDAVIETLMDVAHGVDYLHNSAGVVHNDIRASNILLKTVGCNKRRFKALVADFSHADFINQHDRHNLSGRMSSGEVISTDGVGRRVSSDRSSASSLSTIYSVNKGSVVHQELRQPRQQTWAATGQAILHLAPELLAQTSPPTPASDVYSFAMLMWNLLQRDGKKMEYLKSGQSVADMVHQVVEHQQRPPTLVSTNNNNDDSDNSNDDNDVDMANKNDSIICGKDINVVAIEMCDKLMRDCWHQDPALRPNSGDIIVALRKILRFIKENSVQNGEDEEDV
jgi:serine/threonine protein kinase